MKEWCNNYHCPGDCGKHGHGVQHLSAHRYKKMVLATFDEMESAERRKLREQRAEVEIKSRKAI